MELNVWSDLRDSEEFVDRVRQVTDARDVVVVDQRFVQAVLINDFLVNDGVADLLWGQEVEDDVAEVGAVQDCLVF